MTAPQPQPQSIRVINLVPAALLTLGAILLINFFGHVASPLMAIILAVLVATALNPIVRKLSRWMPRGLAAALTVLVLVVFLVGSVVLALPPTVAQLQGLVKALPTSVEQFQGQLTHLQQRFPHLAPILNINSDMLKQGQTWMTEQLTQSAGSLLGWFKGLGLGLFLALVTLVMIIYTLANPTPLINGVIGSVPQGFRVKATRTLAQILMQMGAWGRATALLMLLMGGAMSLGLYFLGIENWLIFGVLAAIGELVPDIGSIVATTIPALFALAVDPKVALYVVILSIVLHIIEAYIVAPMLMSGAAEMHPLSVMVGILLFSHMFGLVGAFLTVPFLIVIKAVYENFYLTDRPNISNEVAQALIQGDVEEELAQERQESAAKSEEKPAPTEKESLSLNQLETLLEDAPTNEAQADASKSTESTTVLKPKL